MRLKKSRAFVFFCEGSGCGVLLSCCVFTFVSLVLRVCLAVASAGKNGSTGQARKKASSAAVCERRMFARLWARRQFPRDACGAIKPKTSKQKEKKKKKKKHGYALCTFRFRFHSTGIGVVWAQALSAKYLID